MRPVCVPAHVCVYRCMCELRHVIYDNHIFDTFNEHCHSHVINLRLFGSFIYMWETSIIAVISWKCSNISSLCLLIGRFSVVTDGTLTPNGMLWWQAESTDFFPTCLLWTIVQNKMFVALLVLWSWHINLSW